MPGKTDSTTATGLVETGKDFGSGYSPLMKKRSVALLCGEGTILGSVGEIWYFFERELKLPGNTYKYNYCRKQLI